VYVNKIEKTFFGRSGQKNLINFSEGI